MNGDQILHHLYKTLPKVEFIILQLDEGLWDVIIHFKDASSFLYSKGTLEEALTKAVTHIENEHE